LFGVKRRLHFATVGPPEEYRETLVVVRDEARRLSRMWKICHARPRRCRSVFTESRQFYLDELIAECMRAAQSLAVARRIALSYRFDEELLIGADEELIRRMTMNLLDNAIKYTPKVAASPSNAGGSAA